MARWDWRRRKLTIEFMFDNENFDLDAITYEFILKL
jgi:hypothetical protein